LTENAISVHVAPQILRGDIQWGRRKTQRT
jgi:hypothetical protein